MAYFGGINVSQDSVAIYATAKCGGTFNIHLTANLARNLPVIFLGQHGPTIVEKVRLDASTTELGNAFVTSGMHYRAQ